MDTVLTGIKTTGTPHIGNYVGAIRPAIEASVQPGSRSYLFLADYHSLGDPALTAQTTLEIAATWLALGLDTEKVVFYRQSDVPEITELAWILTCVTAKGLMNRAHAYKAAVAENEAAGRQDLDHAIMMNLYCYPVLMAADILMFKATKVPVGRDQKQHVEMARDVAQRFNHHFGDTFVLPEAVISEHVATLPGLDGRKMSKSYNNAIPLFAEERALRKLVMKIKTNSLEPGVPKATDDSALFQIYRAFAAPEETAAIAAQYQAGIGWGEMKQVLFERINVELAPAREEYRRLLAAPERVEDALRQGAERARSVSRPFIAEIRARIGVRPLAR